MGLRSKSESRHEELGARDDRVLTLASARQDFTLGHSMLLQFIFPSFLQLFPPHPLHFHISSEIHWLPSPQTTCSQTTEPRMPIQMKSVLQLLWSWVHFTSSCQILKKKERKKRLLQYKWAILFPSSVKRLWERKNTRQLMVIGYTETLIRAFCSQGAPSVWDQNAASDPREILRLICKPVTMTAHANWSDKSQSEE